MRGTAQKSYRISLAVLYLLVLLYALAAGLRTTFDYDMGWHLATGRWVVQHHAIPSTDVLSYTEAGTRWLYPVFADVLLYLLYCAVGYAGLSVFCALACLATVAYLVRGRDLESLVLAMCAVEAIAFRTGPRPDLFNTVFLAVVLGELWAYQHGASKRLWLLPLIMLFWVNFHPGFFLGLAAIGAYLLLEASDLLFRARRGEALQRLRGAWPWLAGCFAATLFNPWGVKLFSASLTLADLRGQQKGTFNSSAVISEFQPVPISSQLLKQLINFRHPENGFTWLLVIAILVILLAAWRRQPGVIIIQVAAIFLAMQHARLIALFCVATTIIGATLLGEACSTEAAPPAAAEQDPPKSRPLLRVRPGLALVFVCAICALTLLHTADFVSNRTHVVFGTQSRFGVGESSWFPERAASFIQRQQLPGNVFEEFAMGGFAAWRLGPQYRDFIDGRYYPFAPTVLDQESRLLAQPPNSPLWEAAADQWGINVLLLREGASITRQDALAFCQSADWHPVYMDEVSLVLLRNTPANQPWLDQLQIDCHSQQLVPPQRASRKDLYDFWHNAGALLLSLQRNQESEEALRRAEALYPRDPNVKMNLADLYGSQQMFDRAEAEYRACLMLQDSSAPWFKLGRIYLQQRRLPEAEQAFTRAAQMAVRPLDEYMNLARVELWLQHPGAALHAYDQAEANSPYRKGGETYAPGLYSDIADGRSDAYRMLANLPEALEFEQQSVSLNPGVADRWIKLSGLLAATGQIDESQQARRRAMEIESRANQP